MTLRRRINTATLLSTLAATAVTIFASQRASAQVDYTVEGSMSAAINVDGQGAVSFETEQLDFGNEPSYSKELNASSGDRLGATSALLLQSSVLGDQSSRLLFNGRVSGSGAEEDAEDEKVPSANVNFTLAFMIDEPTELTTTGSFESTNSPVDPIPGFNFSGEASFRAIGLDSTVNSSRPSDTFSGTQLLQPGAYSYEFAARFNGQEGGGVLEFNTTFDFTPVGSDPIAWDNSSGGLFSSPGNWFPEQVPTANDGIVFARAGAGYVVRMDQDAEVNNATVEFGTVSWRFNGNAGNKIDIAESLAVGTEAGVRGGLDVIGGTINVGDVNIGTTDNTNALVTLRENAVFDPRGNVTVGGGNDAMAQLFVISGSSLKLDEGENLTVTGSGASLTTDALSIGTTTIGGGIINVTQGADVTVNGDLDILDSDLTIQGPGSDVTVAGNAQFTPGSRVTISDGGRLLPSEAFNEDGVFRINTTGLNDDAPGVRVTGAGSWLRAGAQQIAIGTASDAEVEVLDGGELVTLADIVLGSEGSETFGDLLVRGEGSVGFANSIHMFSVGDGVSGLEVDAGAEVTLGIDLHANNSEVIVSGEGSTLEMDNQFMIRGGAAATLEVKDGGSLIVAAELDDVGVDGTTLIFDSIDPDSLPDGSVLVGGTTVTNDSRIRTVGNIVIGEQSDGYVLVDSASELVTLSDVTLGNGANETSGYLVIDDVDSEFGANRVVVGVDDGAPSLFRVSDGAKALVFAVLDVQRSGVVQLELGGSIEVGLIPEGYTGPRDNYIILGSGGVLTGSGEVDVRIGLAGGVNNLGGNVSSGSSPGTLTIDGDFNQFEEGTLIIEIAGTEPDTEYDVLSVTGDAEIAGTIVFQFIDGFAPTAGQIYNFLEVEGESNLAGVNVEVRGLQPGFDYLIEPEVPGGPFALTALTDGKPTIASDPIQTLPLEHAPGGTVRWPFFAVEGVNYELETSTDMINWAVVSQHVGDGTVHHFAHTDDSTAARFYRIRQLHRP